MAVFSRRNGYNQTFMKQGEVSDTLKRRIMTVFFKTEYSEIDFDIMSDGTPCGITTMMYEMGVTYQFSGKGDIKQRNAEALQKFVLESKEWYVIFDFIERYLYVSKDDTAAKMEKEFNHILEDEVSAYRVLGGLVVPITNEAELAVISEAGQSPYDSVNAHITKAMGLFSDRKNPDYENSIKESISAVESICCIITGESGAQATLGKTLKKLKDNGIYIHKAMESAFSSLYGYTSDEDGIRHGGTNVTNTHAEDAKFMLVSCSAFVNYLIEKQAKSLN